MPKTSSSNRNKTIAAAAGLGVAALVVTTGVLFLRADPQPEQQTAAPVTTMPDVPGRPPMTLAPIDEPPAPEPPPAPEGLPDGSFGSSYPEFDINEEVIIEAPRPDTFNPNIPLPPPAPSRLPTESPLDLTAGVGFIETIDVPYVEGFTTRQWKYFLDPPGQSFLDVCQTLRAAAEAKGYPIILEQCQEDVIAFVMFEGPGYTGIASVSSRDFIIVEAR